MQTPFTMCIPGPQAWRICIDMSPDACSAARGMACADDARARANTTKIDLIMAFLLFEQRRVSRFSSHSACVSVTIR
jgi:hypothetical protein